MSECKHTVTRGREGETGSWCENCGIKVWDVDTRTCDGCQHFKDMGDFQTPICTKHHMIIGRKMHVTYKISKGTCFTEPATTLEKGIV